MLNSADIKVMVPLSYAIPSFMMSISIVIVILRSFKAPFYRLFAIAAMTDMLFWTFTFVCMRARNAPVFFALYAQLPTEGPLLTFMSFAMYYFVYVQYGTSFCIGLNRFSYIAVPLHSTRLWRTYFPYILLAVFLYPLPLTYHIIFAGGYLGWNNPDNHSDGYRLDVNGDGTEGRNSFFMMICSAFFGLLLVGMYVAIGVSLYRRRLLTAEALANGEDTRDTEAKLYLLTSVLFSFMAVTFVLQLLFHFNPPGQTMSTETFFRLMTVQNFAVDLHTCSAPWFLLLLSRAVRQEVLGYVSFINKGSSLMSSKVTPSLQV
ncbi:SRG-34 protein [Aphelenchoides avenae]|nr:SRG-34 protein [Aphelenchus avenae]